MKKEYNIGTIVIMKKEHPCKNNKFVITRVGVDIKIKCLKCSREIMLDRLDFERKLKKVANENE